ncbi:MAG TPA: hypothetical protein VFX39_09570 [Gemmatimonadaceae bacterium]|nr:hypothetical protein [Gemmatimonadaceae bacterium]
MRILLPSLALLAACATGDSAARDTLAVGDTTTPAAADQGCVGDGAVVTGDRAGGVRLGMSAAALREACAVSDTTFTLGEGMTERGLATTVAGARVVALLGAGDSVTRIMVTAPGLATGGGIAVGSDMAALRAAHAAPCTLVGEGRIVAASAALQGVSFATTADYATFATNRTAPLPDTAHVTEILVHGERVCGG